MKVEVVSTVDLFPTPAELARKVIETADIRPGHRVLEPSAGTGALLSAIGGSCFGQPPERGEIVAVEINAKLCNRLRQDFPLTKVICADFLECDDLGTFDRIVMNPPFSGGADIQHIRHAATLLKPGARLVAICAAGPRQRQVLAQLAEESGGWWEDLPAGSFAAAGTNVSTAMVVIEG